MDSYTTTSFVIEYSRQGVRLWRTWDTVPDPKNWRRELPPDTRREGMDFRLVERRTVTTDKVFDYDTSAVLGT